MISPIYSYENLTKKVLDNETAIKETTEIAKGVHKAISFDNYADMINVIGNLPTGVLDRGQSIMIVTLNVPDLWVSAIAEESVEYTYVDDNTFVEAIKTNGSVQVGYYMLSALETQKVDLTDYVKNTDIATSAKAGIIMLNPNGGFTFSGQKLYNPIALEKDFINKTQSHFLRPIHAQLTAKYGIIRASTDSGLTLTDEEKASAAKWLGVPNAYEYYDENLAVDIQFTKGTSITIATGEIAYLVSDRTFTMSELKSNQYPFTFGYTDDLNGGIATEGLLSGGLSGVTVSQQTGYISISKKIMLSSLGSVTLKAYIVNDYANASIGGKTPPQNGTYFTYFETKGVKVESLTRSGNTNTKIDGKYLDVATNELIADLIARVTALENK